MTDSRQKSVPLSQLLASFVRIGLTAFGGGTAAWTHRELVERRGWISDDTFTTGLTFSQVLPGANPVNIALYMGLHLRGGIGGTIAVLGLVTPAFASIVLIGLLYNLLSAYPVTSVILGGLAAVGVGATLSVGVKLARKLKPTAAQIVPILIALGTFVAIGVLQWPMIPVVAVAVPVSIGHALWLERRRRHG